MTIVYFAYLTHVCLFFYFFYFYNSELESTDHDSEVKITKFAFQSLVNPYFPYSGTLMPKTKQNSLKFGKDARLL